MCNAERGIPKTTCSDDAAKSASDSEAEHKHTPFLLRKALHQTATANTLVSFDQHLACPHPLYCSKFLLCCCDTRQQRNSLVCLSIVKEALSGKLFLDFGFVLLIKGTCILLTTGCCAHHCNSSLSGS